MPRKGQSEEKIVYALRQVESGKEVSEACREMGVSAQAFYRLKRGYAGLGVSELRELRQLREENQKLKDASGRSELGQAYFAGSTIKRSLKPAARLLYGLVFDAGFAQLSYRCGLARYEACLRAMQPRLYHMNFGGKVSRNTLAYVAASSLTM